MEQPQLAVFNYKHGGRTRLGGRRKTFFLVSLALALIVAVVAFPAGLGAFLVPLIIFLARSGTLCIGPRYFICGDNIFYYANVTQLRLAEGEGRLSLQMADGKGFVIEREKFPTNARKAHKVEANKAAKFNKVTARIIDKVRRASPAVADA